MSFRKLFEKDILTEGNLSSIVDDITSEIMTLPDTDIDRDDVEVKKISSKEININFTSNHCGNDLDAFRETGIYNKSSRKTGWSIEISDQCPYMTVTLLKV